MFKRQLNLKYLLKSRSYFLFGARGTGKSTLISQILPDAKVYDLLEANQFSRLVRAPQLIEEENSSESLIVIDEIQKLPSLLDEVHRLIVKKNYRFLLTGSSTRKLVHAGANLLAGRALRAELFPLVSREIDDFDLLRYLNRGGLPENYLDDLYADITEVYVNTYLRDEIRGEGAVRKFEAFARFLDVAGLSSGQEINFEGFASDCGVPARTIQNYFQVLYDTLIGFSLPPFLETTKRKPISRSKFFLFDVGIANFLTKRSPVQIKSKSFGDAFEHFIIQEMRAYLSYRRLKQNLCYWRSTSGFEVDMVIGSHLAIEIKSTDLAQDKHLKGIRALKQEQLVKRHILVSHDTEMRKTNDGVEIWPWQKFLDHLWGDRFLFK